MSATLSALLVGVVAGLGVAVPLGAVGVLLLRTGIGRGWQVAAAGALGVASVDLAYAVVATLFGSAVAAVLRGHEHQVRLIGAAVLAVIALRGLWRVWRSRGRLAEESAALPGPGEAARPWQTWVSFVGLTALNPMTVIYFAVVAAGLASRWHGVAAPVAFVVGVGVASAAWQLVLAGLGAFAGARSGPRVRVALGVLGDVVVLALAVALTLR